MTTTSHLACEPDCYPPSGLSIEGLCVEYDGRPALHNASARFAMGEFSAIMGPNGAGKSSMLKAILGLVKPSEGTIRLGGKEQIQPHVAYVPQQQTLDWAFPVSVQDVAMMGRTGRLGWWKLPRKEDHERVQAALEQVDLWPLRKRHISELSGGQRQRALLARMLVRDAAVMLLDEPLTGLDKGSSEQILQILQEQAQQGRAVIMVTHDMAQASQCCAHLVLVNRSVIAEGSPAEVCTPENIARTFGLPDKGAPTWNG